ncbi:hypothetical protein ACFSMW_12260 [Virgibacillus halophilus]|uniref:Uncharacterized protein n=1 Tax=Tigheibacillus halophilus TaxID=361280 RepID=A0ABU5C7X2_9BACI|nr:hypothetical protein [Virgibacillus halophilus]
MLFFTKEMLFAAASVAVMVMAGVFVAVIIYQAGVGISRKKK